MILISCGFDGAVHDELGWSNLCPLEYYRMTKELMKICPKVVVMQEGGYNTDFLGQHASGVVKALIGHESYGELTQADVDVGFSGLDEIRGENAKQWAKDNVEETRAHLKSFWSSIDRQ